MSLQYFIGQAHGILELIALRKGLFKGHTIAYPVGLFPSLHTACTGPYDCCRQFILICIVFVLSVVKCFDYGLMRFQSGFSMTASYSRDVRHSSEHKMMTE